MKKIFKTYVASTVSLVAGILMLALPVQAQTDFKVVETKLPKNIKLLSRGLTVDHLPKLISCTNMEDTCIISLYHPDMSIEREFNVTCPAEKRLKITQKREIAEVIETVNSSVAVLKDVSLDDARAYVEKNCPDFKESKKGDQIIFKEELPEMARKYYILRWEGSDTKGTLHKDDILASFRFGEWIEEETTEERSMDANLLVFGFVSDSDINQDNFDEFYISQNLFNDDDAYEYMVPIFEYSDNPTEIHVLESEQDFEGTYVDIKREMTYESKLVGMHLKNEYGTLIDTLNFKKYLKNENSRMVSAYVFSLNESHYLMIDIEQNESQFESIMYKFNTSGNIKQVKTFQKKSIN